MVQIDRTNTAIVSWTYIRLQSVINRIEAIVQSKSVLKSNPYFLSASVHQSLDRWVSSPYLQPVAA